MSIKSFVSFALTVAAAAAFVLSTASSGQALELCAKADRTDPTQPREKSKISMRSICKPGREVSVGTTGGLALLQELDQSLSIVVAPAARGAGDTPRRVPGPYGKTLVFSGVNLQIVSGSGSTSGEVGVTCVVNADCPSTIAPTQSWCEFDDGAVQGNCVSTNGSGNLIVGYNEDSGGGANKVGSHNLVVGPDHTYSKYGGLVAGSANALSAVHSSVTGGSGNAATGRYSSIAAGHNNIALASHAAVTGGESNWATGAYSAVSGGRQNIAGGAPVCLGGPNGGLPCTYDQDCGVDPSTGFTGVCGGGAYSSVCAGKSGTASGDYSSVAGGQSNEARAEYGSVTGGGNNLAGGGSCTGGPADGTPCDSDIDCEEAACLGSTHPSVNGGYLNQASGQYAAVAGGNANFAANTLTMVSGGQANTAGQALATVAGGKDNRATGGWATVVGGEQNSASEQYSTVGGGYSNTASGEHATIAGGKLNSSPGDFSAMLGGFGNLASGNFSVAAGGRGTTVPYGDESSCADTWTMSEGETIANWVGTAREASHNEARGEGSVVVGGYCNLAAGNYSSVLGSRKGETRGSGSVVVGGGNGLAGDPVYHPGAVVVGGSGNIAMGSDAVAVGGWGNVASGSYSATSGGHFNWAAGKNSLDPGDNLAFTVVSGGYGNIASIQYEHLP